MKYITTDWRIDDAASFESFELEMAPNGKYYLMGYNKRNQKDCSVLLCEIDNDKLAKLVLQRLLEELLNPYDQVIYLKEIYNNLRRETNNGNE